MRFALLYLATGRPRVYFDIQIGEQKAGRIAFELVSLLLVEVLLVLFRSSNVSSFPALVQ